MSISSDFLLQDLTERNRLFIQEIEQLVDGLPSEALQWKANSEQWSVLQCMEHLNRYCDFYLPELEKVIKQAPKGVKSHQFHSGWIGNYFVQLISPQNGQVTNAIKTNKDMNPSQDQLDLAVLSRFFKHQEQFLQILSSANEVNLNKNKTAITLTTWIKLRLGDTLRFMVYHHLRHGIQMKNILQHWREQTNVLGKVQ